MWNSVWRVRIYKTEGWTNRPRNPILAETKQPHILRSFSQLAWWCLVNIFSFRKVLKLFCPLKRQCIDLKWPTPASQLNIIRFFSSRIFGKLQPMAAGPGGVWVPCLPAVFLRQNYLRHFDNSINSIQARGLDLSILHRILWGNKNEFVCWNLGEMQWNDMTWCDLIWHDDKLIFWIKALRLKFQRKLVKTSINCMEIYRKKFFSKFHPVAPIENPHLFPFVACCKAAVLRPWQEMVGQPGEGSLFSTLESGTTHRFSLRSFILYRMELRFLGFHQNRVDLLRKYRSSAGWRWKNQNDEKEHQNLPKAVLFFGFVRSEVERFRGPGVADGPEWVPWKHLWFSSIWRSPLWFS